MYDAIKKNSTTVDNWFIMVHFLRKVNLWTWYTFFNCAPSVNNNTQNQAQEISFDELLGAFFVRLQ